jgi:hypothetical protein
MHINAYQCRRALLRPSDSNFGQFGRFPYFVQFNLIPTAVFSTAFEVRGADLPYFHAWKKF